MTTSSTNNSGSATGMPAGPDKGRILDGIFLCYSGRGHVRFSIPRELCTVEAARRLERGLVLKEGVYRVRVFRDNGKLSVRFHENGLDAKRVASSLKEIVENLPPTAFVTSEPEAKGLSAGSHSAIGLPVILRKIIAGRSATLPSGLQIDAETERKITAILNEVLVFYLIRLHWTVIMNRLIKQPLRNVGPWAALSYLLFLYVRNKKRA